ncbi:hypothetical protein C7212DRAFT_361247 [Tuber magnatum]|uniref:Uncharacterized protein n=1 Tax=Tuber magnatum TaxID=42249 RepID=A0A317T1Z2_9PEZI|nr:hypothetical protein C7212DRAFT_361247 [Tuber magnatum]
MSKSKGGQSSAYRGGEEEVGGGSSSAATPLPIRRKQDHSREVLPEYYDAVDGSVQSVGGQNGGVRGDGGGGMEGETGADAPPEFDVYVPKAKVVFRTALETTTRADPRGRIPHQVELRGRCPRTVTDFYLIYDIPHLLPEQNHRGEPTLATVPPDKAAYRGNGGFKSFTKNPEEGGTVRDWADRYCEDQSALKEFAMKKVVVGHDQAYLRRRVDECIRSTNYRGTIYFKFPIYDSRVKVYPTNRISKLRRAAWFRFIFCITFLWIFAWPYLWFVTKRYRVARMTWRMSRRVRDENGETRRECVQTEEEWMRHWGPAIKHAVKAGKLGYLSTGDITAARAASATRS